MKTEAKQATTTKMKKHDVPESSVAKMPNFKSSSNSIPFETLPTELIHAILCKLDITSFLQFRAVSRSALSLTNAMPEHRLLDHDCHSAIRRMVRWKMEITISDIYSGLIRRCCNDCGQPTPYLFLYNARRVCVNCSQLPQYHFVPVEAMEEVAHRLCTGSIKDVADYLPQIRFNECVSLVACESGLATVWRHFVLAHQAGDILVGLGADAKEVLQELGKIRGYFRRHDRLLVLFPWYSMEDGRLETRFASQDLE